MFFPVVGQFCYTEGAKYRFTLTRDLNVHVMPALGRHWLEDNGKEWLHMAGHQLVVRAGYSWDGSSPKARLLGRWIGTPDYTGTRAASCVHDACYQFLHAPCFPLSRWQADQLFHEIMARRGFRAAGLYSGTVKAVGGVFYRMSSAWTRREGQCALCSS
jgi:hypothetical protein